MQQIHKKELKNIDPEESKNKGIDKDLILLAKNYLGKKVKK